MKKVEVRLTLSPDRSFRVGVLVEESRRVYFEYDAGFLELGLEISPFKLPLRLGLVEHFDRKIGPLPGVFADSLPDGWVAGRGKTEGIDRGKREHYCFGRDRFTDWL